VSSTDLDLDLEKPCCTYLVVLNRGHSELWRYHDVQKPTLSPFCAIFIAEVRRLTSNIPTTALSVSAGLVLPLSVLCRFCYLPLHSSTSFHHLLWAACGPPRWNNIPRSPMKMLGVIPASWGSLVCYSTEEPQQTLVCIYQTGYEGTRWHLTGSHTLFCVLWWKDMEAAYVLW